MSEVIRHSLGLAMSLIDTTTGKHINDSSVSFIFEREDISKPVYRGDGTYIILNYCRENFSLKVKLSGYETLDLDVDYELLDSRLPMLDVFMIPKPSSRLDDDVISLKGTLSGLTEISLVRMADVRAHTDAYEAKKKLLTVFEKGKRLSMEGSPFGIIGPTKESYEIVEVIDQCGDNKVILRNPLMEEFLRNAPISRIIYGYIDKSGSYTIAVRNDGADLRAILRLKVDGEIRFLKVDFSNPDEITLS